MAPSSATLQQAIVVTSTTSTEQSGQFSVLLPAFRKDSDLDVKVVALGTGQAIDVGRRGDADELFVHDKAAGEKVVAEGFAVKHFEVMVNDFVLVGPASDPLQVRGNDVVGALQKIAAGNAAFISRGDNSGIHAAGLRFWILGNLVGRPGSGYQSCGCGMGAALNMASSSAAYVLTDRGTWLNFKNRGDLQILVQGDKRLFNQYGVLLVNPARHPHVQAALGQQFIDWLTSAAGQGVIAGYKIGGEQLFFPNAGRR